MLLRSSRFLLLSALGVAALALPARAQFIKPGQSFDSSLSYSGSSEVRRLGAATKTSATYYKAGYDYGLALNEDSLIGFGVDYARTEFSLNALNPVPEELSSLEFKLSAMHRLDTQWSLVASASPGWAVAGGNLSDKGFRVPLMIGAFYAQSREFQWAFGVAYNRFSEYQFVPYAGFNWNFAPQWSLSLGIPETALTYRFSDSLRLKALVGVEGGSYYVKQTASYATTQVVGGSQPLPANGLKNTFLDYREIRAGLGADFAVSGSTAIKLEAGAVANRKWQYHDYDVNYNGRPTAYARLSLSMRF